MTILLRIANQTAYVWDVDDIAAIRTTHRICGILSGTLPHLSQQNVFLGLPLTLMPEEVVLLVEIGAAALVDDPSAHLSPTPAQLRKWSRDHQNSVRSQLAFIESKTAKEGRAMSTEAIRKRKGREEKRRKAATAKAAKDAADAHEADIEDEDGDGDDNAEQADGNASTITVSSGSTVTPSTASKSSFLRSPSPVNTNLPYTISIPASSASLEWYSPKQIYTSLLSAREAGVWTYPSTLAERARCGVFKDLWKQGYFMGGGIKFGGEYLVYPGDPLRYHSHFTATVVESPVATLSPMEIVAHGRLGTATKKSHLLCGWDDEKQEVSYFSIEWAGFG